MDEALSKVPSKYVNFINVFSLKLAAKFPEHTRINAHTIKLVDDQQPPYGPIYSLGLMELKILKAYIKNNPANKFIKPSNSFTRALIFLDKKLDDSLKLYMDYRDLNNLTIKNQYPLPLVEKSLD